MVVKKQSLWGKVLSASEDQLWDKDELLDVLHWWKQFVAVIVGVVCGIVPILHLSGLIVFAAVLLLTTVIFYRSVLKIDQEEYGGHQELLQEGLPFSIAMFVLVWILVYSFSQ